MGSLREIQHGQTLYDMDDYFLDGMRARREGDHILANPHTENTWRHDQWNTGHTLQHQLIIGQHKE